MSRSIYSRFNDQLLVSGVPLAIPQAGRVIYVSNSTTPTRNGVVGLDNTSSGFNPDQPLASIQYAVANMVVANRGDTIIVGTNHAETLADATSLTLNVAGVSIIGLGDGNARPTLTLSAAGSNIPISAANCSIINCVIIASATAVTAGITVSASDCTLDIETRDTDSTHGFAIAVNTTAAGDRLKAKLKHEGFTASTVGTAYVSLVGSDNTDIDLNYYGAASTAVVNTITTASLGVTITGKIHNGTTSITKDFVDTQGSSKWTLNVVDGVSGTVITGGSGVSVAALPLTTDLLSLPRCVASAEKVLTTGNVNMFTISGGPIKILELVGIVTTGVQAQATSVKITCTTTAPAATVDFSAAAVDLTGAAVGASIRHINTTGILTVVTAGFVMEGNAFATQDTGYLVPVGTLQINNASASNTGGIAWYLRYVPLSTLSRVV